MAKRGNGEGSIFKRANGRWYSALTYRDDFGEVKRREVSGKTQAEVRAKLREIRERVEAGAPVKDASISMAAWLEDWATKALPASDRKQATIDLYTTIARRHLAPKLGNVPLDRLRPSDVEALVLARRRRCSRQFAVTASRPSTASCWRPGSAAVRPWPCTGETSTSMQPSSGCAARCRGRLPV
jgi:integrase